MCILLVNHASGYIEEKGVNKYLIFESADEIKELLKKCNDFWNGTKKEMQTEFIFGIWTKVMQLT